MFESVGTKVESIFSRLRAEFRISWHSTRMSSRFKSVLCFTATLFLATTVGYSEKQYGWLFSVTDEGKPVLQFKVDRKASAEERDYSLESLKTALAEYREADTQEHLKGLSLFEFLKSPKIQKELFQHYKKNHPELLAAAMKSGGNMHNPKVIPLRKELLTALRNTPTFLEMKRLLSEVDLQIKDTSFEKFWIEKDDKGAFLRFFFFLWVELEESEAEAKDDE